jgi:hypothetical protein
MHGFDPCRWVASRAAFPDHVRRRARYRSQSLRVPESGPGAGSGRATDTVPVGRPLFSRPPVARVAGHQSESPPSPPRSFGLFPFEDPLILRERQHFARRP